MSLINRLTLFFLAALVLVVLGFSVVLYSIAHVYLHRQLDDQLIAALDTLEAAVDVESGGLEWEPKDRRLSIARDPAREQLQWCVSDSAGKPIDASSPTATELGLANWRAAAWPTNPPDGTAIENHAGRRVAGRRLRLQELLQLGRGHAEDDGPEDDIEYPEMFLTASVSPAAMQASLNHLAATLLLLSLGILVALALLARTICARALAPVHRMAVTARGMTGANQGQRLPTPKTDDELADLSRSFNDLLGRLEDTIDRQQRFAADASHQLRTPLAGLMSLAEVTARRERPAGEYRDALRRIHDEARRLQSIIESLLFLARLDHDGAAPPREWIPLNGWVTDQLMRWQNHPRGADFKFHPLVDDSVGIRAQGHLLAQIFDNLLDNACQHSAAGTPIEIETIRAPGRVGLAVTDHGTGIAPRDLSHIFEPFYRSREIRGHTQGVGLGLAVARRIVTSFDGDLTATSILGQGTRFQTLFPPAIGHSDPRASVANDPDRDIVNHSNSAAFH